MTSIVATKQVNEVRVEAHVLIGWPGHRPYFIREVYPDGTHADIGVRRWSTSKKQAERNVRALLKNHR